MNEKEKAIYDRTEFNKNVKIKNQSQIKYYPFCYGMKGYLENEGPTGHCSEKLNYGTRPQLPPIGLMKV